MNGVILRSADYGDSFERTDLPFKLGGKTPGRSMDERPAVDPNDNRILYFGVRGGNGLWRSNDYGETWTQDSTFPAIGSWADGYYETEKCRGGACPRPKKTAIAECYCRIWPKSER